MMRSVVAIAVIAATTIAGASAQACAAGSAYELKGNWYCQAVNAISYTNFGTPGQYNKVTSFNNEGPCTSAPTEYAGGISPMDEEVSWHFRGPLNLKQFAFYLPGTSNKQKRDTRPALREKRHAHNHYHAKGVNDREAPAQVKQRAPCAMVTATIDGQIASWMNSYECDPSGSIPTAALGSEGPHMAGTPASPTAMPTMNAGAGNWARQSYYTAENQTAEGLVFLNHNGGQGSGVFDYIHGNSLSYSSSDGTSGSATPQTLADTMLSDDVEVVVMSSTPCSDNDCGTVRPGTVAYHGFEGSQKLFLLEFSMPLTGKNGWVQDMPAIWTLNAQIPNTLQYGDATCSCWESGCGEWDIFEVLDSGNTRAKSTFHGNPSGGDSNYFNRPTDSTIMAAVIFDGDTNSGHIIVLPDGASFDDSITNDIVADWVNQMHSEAQIAVFQLGSR